MWQIKCGKCIYTSPSGYKVYQNSLFRWLTLGSNALQTVINRKKPHKPVLYYLPELTMMARKNPGTSCLMGLGGGAIPHMLSAQSPGYSLNIVECSAEIIDIAQHFFMLDKLANLTIIHNSAQDYIRDCEQRYTHLMIDIYDTNQFPQECHNEAFFMHCKDKLEPKGFLVINLAYAKEHWAIFQLIKTQFKNTLVMPVNKSANIVIIAGKDDNREQFLQEMHTLKEIKKIAWSEVWGCMAVR